MNGTNLESRHAWLIAARSEGQHGEPGFYCLQQGWGLGVQHATVYTHAERLRYIDDLPNAAGHDAEWISLDQVHSPWAGDYHGVLDADALRTARGLEIEAVEDEGTHITTTTDPQFYGVYVRCADGLAQHVGDYYFHANARALAQRLAADYGLPILRDVGDLDAVYLMRQPLPLVA